MMSVGRSRWGIAGLLSLALVLAGCAAKSPPSSFYTLGSLEAPTEAAPTRSLIIAVGPLEIPEVLDRPQLVTRKSPYELEISEFHRWGGSFSGEFLRSMAENLAVLMDSDRVILQQWTDFVELVDYRVGITVTQFDGALGGEVDLRARWGIVRPVDRTILAISSSVVREPVQGEDHAALVAAMSRAVKALSRDIADELKRQDAAR